ncbi:MAG: tRNA (adenosine(37)-N6)-threonylcarbamoyltransferase complex dimerization subunit type 1 TsaB [Verrucomicrobiae bacterium]|nr:tRNA (adenosine(37)-N6)-threonylcarbamoyltransferase complex dimerization subunit type 1 TsaB [Verrucomicrobiae bacterium]MDW7980045.1 tRNA (adenosine(37)-N6)-threonylcarbamoyltransferase complex dimerization subunit type 1 TsaB [Verrucomicrobiales bacterium]
MKILALEFSSSHRSVAVAVLEPHAPPARATRLAELHRAVRLSEVIDASRASTVQPFRMIEEALRQAELDRNQIECVAVGLGPGSYTGIRAAIAIAQGWQLARGVKLTGVSSVLATAANAWDSGLRGRCSVIVDAQRNEFYLAGYELDEAGATETEPLRLASAEEVNRLAEAGRVLIGPDAHAYITNARAVYPSAAWIARLAAAQAEFVPGEKLEPIYLRETSFVKAPPPRIRPDTE